MLLLLSDNNSLVCFFLFFFFTNLTGFFISVLFWFCSWLCSFFCPLLVGVDPTMKCGIYSHNSLMMLWCLVALTQPGFQVCCLLFRGRGPPMICLLFRSVLFGGAVFSTSSFDEVEITAPAPSNSSCSSCLPALVVAIQPEPRFMALFCFLSA